MATPEFAGAAAQAIVAVQAQLPGTGSELARVALLLIALMTRAIEVAAEPTLTSTAAVCTHGLLRAVLWCCDPKRVAAAAGGGAAARGMELPELGKILMELAQVGAVCSF